MSATSQARLLHPGIRLHLAARTLCALVVVAVATALTAGALGWTAALAIGLLATAVALLAHDRRDPCGRGRIPLAHGLGLAVLPLGAATLTTEPTTAVSLALFAAALTYVPGRAGRAELLLLLGSLLPYLALLGYAAKGEALYRMGSPVGMAFVTALCLVLLGLAALAVVPGGWLQRIDAGEDVGAAVLRLAVPVTVALPPAVTGFLNVLARLGWLSDELLLVVAASVQMGVTAALVVFLAARLRAVDAERRESWVLAEHDPLTGIANRRGFEREVERWVHERDGSPAAILMADLDNFKEINDTCGHASGDRVLTAFAQRLRSSMRDGDVVARLGGDEFVVLMPGAGPEMAAAGGDRVLAAAEAVAGSLPDAKALAVSVGASVFEPTDAGPDAVVARADLALYRAKTEGKRRVVLWPATGPPTVTPTGITPPVRSA